MENVYVKSLSPAQRRQLWGAAVLSGFVAVLVPLTDLLRGREWSATSWVEPLMFLAFTAALPLIVAVATSARLVIGDRGMSYSVALPPGYRWARRFVCWDARWEDISLVQLFGGHGMAAFVVKGRAFTTRLPLWGWLPEHQARAGASSPEASGLAERDVEESPIWRAMRAHGVMAQNNGMSSAMSFDLARHDSTRRMLVAYVVLGLSGLATTLLEDETYIADGYGFMVPHVVAGVVAVLASWILLRRSRPRLPNGIPEGVAVTAVLAVGMFSYGALVSLNKLVVPMEPATYRTDRPCTTLVPDDPTLPRIVWSAGFGDFWCQYKVGTGHVIPVRRGLFNTYQFDQGAYVKRIHAYRDRAGEGRTRQRRMHRGDSSLRSE